MKRSSAFVVLLLIVLVVVTVLCVRIFTKDLRESTPAETQVPAAQTLPPVETPDEAPATPAATEPPAETEAPQETETPFETRPPAETPPAPTPVPLQADGSFRSNTGTYLDLVVDWAATDGPDDSVTLQVVFYAQSYSFTTSALYNALELTVNGQTYSANSPEISYGGEALALTPLATFSVELPRGSADVSAVWHYRGSYSGTELEDISAAAVLDLS